MNCPEEKNRELSLITGTDYSTSLLQLHGYFLGDGGVIFMGKCTGQFSGVKCFDEFLLKGIFL